MENSDRSCPEMTRYVVVEEDILKGNYFRLVEKIVFVLIISLDHILLCHKANYKGVKQEDYVAPDFHEQQISNRYNFRLTEKLF